MLNRKTRFWNHSICHGTKGCDIEISLAIIVLEPFYIFNMVPKAKGKNMTKTFQNFKEEYLKELGPEAKEEYNKALEELKEEQQK